MNDELELGRTAIKERVIDVALSQFLTHGVRSVTMDEIASSVRISKRTLYEMFTDKETLLKYCIISRRDEMRVYLDGVLRNTQNVLEVLLAFYRRSVEALHHINNRFWDDVKKYPEVYAIVVESRDKEADDELKFFKMGVDQGLFRKDIDYVVVNTLFRDLLRIYLKTEGNYKFTMLQVYESFVLTYIRGIVTPKGNEMLDDFLKENPISDTSWKMNNSLGIKRK
ncbi:MAG: TetR/AcrR family transcriptional regulator [Bacteroides sp.]|nr:TetR/AcrR family transcriptional regulator [Bacteroides sp.]MDD4720420.1 TetR/AcrR family transcriptional regulator [Bacteroides sp.]